MRATRKLEAMRKNTLEKFNVSNLEGNTDSLHVRSKRLHENDNMNKYEEDDFSKILFYRNYI